jgi:hypothetical protein
VDYSGILSGYPDVTITATAAFDSPNAGARNVSVTYSISGPDAQYYIKPPDATLSGTISQKQLTITSQASKVTTSKVYDNSNTAAATRGDLGGVENSEGTSVIDVALASSTYNSKDVSTANTITLTYSMSGTGTGNYIAPAPFTVAGSITPQTLSVTDPTFQRDKEYDGNNAVSGGVAPGTLTGGLGDVGIMATGTYANKDVAVDGSGNPIAKAITVN